MQIAETTTVAEIAAELPASIRVFERYGVDFCCLFPRTLALAETAGVAGEAR